MAGVGVAKTKSMAMEQERAKDDGEERKMLINLLISQLGKKGIYMVYKTY